MPDYRAYGLCIQSVVQIPEFLDQSANVSKSTHTSYDVIIILDETIAHRKPLRAGTRMFSSVSEFATTLFWPHVGTFQIRNGREIRIALEDKSDQTVVRLFLTGPVFGVLLHQRGWTTLHGSAVSINDRACIFLGKSGWGKSTLCAAFDAQGHRVLSDDIAVVKFDEAAHPVVCSAFPRLKIWPDSARAIGHDPEQLPRVRPEIEKRTLTPNNFVNVPVSLHRIYVLDQGEHLAIIPIAPTSAILECVIHTFSGILLENVHQESRFVQCARLVQEVGIKRLIRPWSLNQIPFLIDAIAADITRNE